jgi:hypothetical protein
MRHLPSVGAVLWPPEAIPYLVVKQDNNGTTFVISGIELPWPAGGIDATAQARPARSAPGPHPTTRDIPPTPNLNSVPPPRRHRPALLNRAVADHDDRVPCQWIVLAEVALTWGEES